MIVFENYEHGWKCTINNTTYFAGAYQINDENYGDATICEELKRNKSTNKLIEKLEGTEAFLKIFHIEFEKIDETKREVILAVFPNIEKLIADGKCTKMPEEAYKIAISKIGGKEKFTTSCPRCGGSGKHSYNEIDKDRCFKCKGTGKVLKSRFTDKFIKEIREEFES